MRMKKIFVGLGVGIGLPCFGAYQATSYMFPELKGNKSQLYKGFIRMSRTLIAGLKMTYI